MTLVALKMNRVVSIEKDGLIDVSMEHDKVVTVPDDSNFKMGWIYAKPPIVYAGALYFYPYDDSEMDNIPKEKGVCYAVDEQGNQYVVENPEETT